MKEVNDLLRKLEISIRDGEDKKKQLILLASIRILINEKYMFKSGHLPKFYNSSFKINLYRLIPTSEVTLVNNFSESILKKCDLPIRRSSFSSCFRKEENNLKKHIIFINK